MTDAVDAVDMLLSQLDSLGFISTISPSGYAYVFNKSEEIVARITTDNTVSNNCLVNSGASIKDIFSLSQELEQFRKDKQIVVSVSPMIYDTESKKVLYGQDAVNFKKLLDLRTDTVN
jgi:hypothetical protein